MNTRNPGSHRTALRGWAALGGLVIALGSPAPAIAMTDGRYTVDVLVDGIPQAEYPARGTTYLEAVRGRDYAIRLTNHTSERVAVALSVDGLNSIDARHTTAAEARKWILGPWESVVISGWQTSGSTARRFFFTTEPGSYGAWLGRTSDLGVITASFFRARRPIPQTSGGWGTWGGWPGWQRDAPPAEQGGPQARNDAAGESRSAEKQARGGGQGAAESAPSAPADARRDAAADSAPGKSTGALSNEYAATGIGGEMDHPVQMVQFDHEAQPAATLQMRYEFRDALVRLGVLRWPDCPPSCGPRCPSGCPSDPMERREASRGFQDQPWAPDPYRGRSR